MKPQLSKEFLGAVDASVIIDAFAFTTTRTPESRAANQLFESAGMNRIRLAVPAPALAEYLASVPLDKQDEEAKKFTALFMILPFDVPAVREAAKIQKAMMDLGRWHALVDEFGRVRVKTDLMILACAIAHGAACVYSADERFCRWGSNYLPVYQPQIVGPHYQPPLMPDDE